MQQHPTHSLLQLQELKAYYVRNLMLKFSANPGCNLFLGANGQGKTNILETIYLSCHLKPFRSIKNTTDLVCHTSDNGYISAQFTHTSSLGNQIQENFTVELNLEPSGKKASLNGKVIKSARAIANKAACIAFVPNDLDIVHGGASGRRNFLDNLSHILFSGYIDIYKRYEKILNHRNKLLKLRHISNELASFTQLLIESGSEVIQKRLDALRLLIPFYTFYLNKISNNRLTSTCTYKTSLAEIDGEELMPAFADALEQKAREEIIRGTTLAGPHLDDILLSLGNFDARHNASRGQARAMVLALKLASIACITQHRGLSPILLLDDVFGELDPHHALHLYECIQAHNTQTFISATHRDALPADMRTMPAWEVCDGKLEQAL